MRKRIIGALMVFLLAPINTYASKQEVYVALGDSLAAGQTPYRQIDAGYTDFIALQLMRQGQLSSFSKALTFPGYRVQNVIESVQSEQASDLLQNASLITISAGANNLLPLISYNPDAGSISYSQLSANFALNEVRVEMKKLLALVNEKAPSAKVYVMGYFFPYVSVHSEQLSGATSSLKRLNAILKQEAELAGNEYVDVYDAFNKQRAQYLTNKSDVHPNQQGYRIMANEMLKLYGGNAAFLLQENAMPEPNPKTFEEMLSLQNEQNEQNEVAQVPEVMTTVAFLTSPKPIQV